MIVNLCKLIGLFFLIKLIAAQPLANEEYDFVIVGGGTAGCAVAGRLSENGKHSVLVIHDGGDSHPDLEIPELAMKVFTEPSILKFYKTKENESNKTDYVFAGRPLGGGSAVNCMTWNRGSPYDFDNWAKITKDDSWKYDNLLKYFKKSENYLGEFPSDQHGYGGPITISQPKYAPLLDKWLSAGQDLGYPIGDANGPQKVGFQPVEFSKKFGQRVSSYTGYIKPYIDNRPNLKVIKYAEAKRIIFEGKKAIGVKYTMTINGTEMQEKFATARKEVIISAGSIGSPVLLMRSGIGPKVMMDKVGLPLVKDLPVGRTLHDHIYLSHAFVINNKSITYIPKRDLTPEFLQLYKETGDGPYSASGDVFAQVFSSSTLAKRNGEADWPDIQFLSGPRVFHNFDAYADKIETTGNEGFVITSSVIARPKSSGWVELNSENVDAPPEIELGYFRDPRDLDVMVDGKLLLKMYEETPTFKNLNARYPYPPVPVKACQHIHFRSDEYWKCLTRQLYSAGFHVSGTCRMGRGVQDEKAVVDSNLKVLGIQNLRVVDASIMPVITNANLQAPIYAIAEKTSEAILREWESPQGFEIKDEQ